VVSLFDAFLVRENDTRRSGFSDAADTMGVAETVFTAADFSYIGIHVIDGIETMCWSEQGQEICAANC